METTTRTLPDNAYRKLKDGETYEPVVPAGAAVPESPGKHLGAPVVAIQPRLRDQHLERSVGHGRDCRWRSAARGSATRSRCPGP